MRRCSRWARRRALRRACRRTGVCGSIAGQCTRGPRQGVHRPDRDPFTSSLAASSTLAKQIEAGAPRMSISRPTFSGWTTFSNAGCCGRVPARSPATRWCSSPPRAALFGCASGRGSICRAARGGRLAVADPDSVPAGIYAREALQSSECGRASSRGWCGPRTSERLSSTSRGAMHRSASFTAPMRSWRKRCASSACFPRTVIHHRIPGRAHAPRRRAAARYLAFITSAEADRSSANGASSRCLTVMPC